MTKEAQAKIAEGLNEEIVREMVVRGDFEAKKYGDAIFREEEWRIIRAALLHSLPPKTDVYVLRHPHHSLSHYRSCLDMELEPVQ